MRARNKFYNEGLHLNLPKKKRKKTLQDHIKDELRQKTQKKS
jgi:hypothetical protein